MTSGDGFLKRLVWRWAASAEMQAETIIHDTAASQIKVEILILP